MTTTKHGHCCSRSAFGKVRFSGHKYYVYKNHNFQIGVLKKALQLHLDYKITRQDLWLEKKKLVQHLLLA